MASKTTLNAKNLELLGAPRLAELLIEISTGSAVAQRRLRLELAGAQSPAEAARAVAKRLASIARSRSRIGWKTRKTLVRDLESQLAAIRTQIAPSDPAAALDLTWRFLQLATPVLTRCDDSSGQVADVFGAAGQLLGDLAPRAALPVRALAETAFAALGDNSFGQYDGLIARLAPALGAEGLALLRARLEDLADAEGPVPHSGPRLAQDRVRRSMMRRALKDIADVTGDPVAYAAQHDAAARRVPEIAAQIAQRFLAADRPSDALVWLDDAATDQRQRLPDDWAQARLAALDALGRADEAQAFRLACFHRSFRPQYLRDHLKRLPDFDDIEAEDAALTQVAQAPALLPALVCLLEWPALDRAARLVEARWAELDGEAFDTLSAAAEALAPRHPLAATLLLRAMIDATLKAARASRYLPAARHLAECAALAPHIESFGPFPPHEAYLARLQREHARRAGFWALVD